MIMSLVMKEEKGMDVIELIKRFQNELGIPDCFVLSEEKLMDNDTLTKLVIAFYDGKLSIADNYVILEIIKQWLIMKQRT